MKNMKKKNNEVIAWCTKTLLITALVFTVSSSVNAQRRLVPCDIIEYRIWNKFFENYYQKDAFCQYLVSPSFSNPYALYLKDADTLVVKDAEKEYKMVCDSTIHHHLSMLITHAVATSMFTPITQIGLDGTSYFFFESWNGVTCWSPDEYTNCGRLVHVMEEVVKAVKTENNSLLQSQKPTVDSLITMFKSYYPDDYNTVTVDCSGLIEDGKDTHYVSISSYHERINMTFTYPEKKYNQSIANKLKLQYGKVLQEAARWAFMNTYAIDWNWEINIIVDNNSPSKFQKLKYDYEFTIQEKDINTDNLIRLFKENLPLVLIDNRNFTEE
jgi:hypothetical protein